MSLQDRDYYREHHKELNRKLNKKNVPEPELTWTLLFKALMTLGGTFIIIKTLLEISNLA